MRKDLCRSCSERERCRDTFTSWIFFLIGIAATIAVRIVTVLGDLDPIYGKAAWYFGVAGFFIFFIYKFRVDASRARMIRESRLADKLRSPDRLTDDDYGFIGSILCSLTSNKDRINYFFIFATSVLAILAAVYMDFFR